jgi:hypothetical protein
MIPVGGAPGLQRPASAAGAAGAATTQKSLNWAGYATTRGGKSFRLVTATFFVPYLNCAATSNLNADTYSAHWVGLDGFSAKADSVEQDGIEADCLGSGTTPRYRAWYEMFPKPEVPSTIRISSGDSITASVSYSSATRKFRLTVRDNTNHHHFSVARACAAGVRCPRNSAEAISEAPSNNKGELLPLADYGAVAFSKIAITDGAGHRGGLISTHWSHTRIVQYGAASNKRIGRPTAIRDSGFANYWLGPI